LALLVEGCVQLPAIDRDIARADATADAPGAITLMRQQDERIAKTPFVAGNGLTLLRNGGETYAAMVASIKAARHRIDMESYTFDAVEGAKFADLLLAKRAQGVEVNLIYDAWGSLDAPAALFDRLRQGGVNVLEYHPIADALDINNRDHRKLLVVDAAVVIVGGVNVSTVYKNHGRQAAATGDPDEMPWRDTDVEIDGPAAAEFEHIFLETWHWNKGAAIPPPPPTPTIQRGSALVQAIDGDPNDNRPMIYRTLLVSLALARKSIHLTTGFFVPTPDLDRALKRAARRGVDVEIVVPAHSDSDLSIAAGRSEYMSLLKAGVHIYERLGVVLHAKTAVIDGTLSIIGSSNLDWRSVIYNTEDDAVIIDRAFGQKMEAMFADDIARSHEVDRRQWAERPFGERVNEWRARLLEFFL
jgi:cardiolipin synthase